MSHLHPVDGFANTAAQYQAYLDRRKAVHLDEEHGKVRRKMKATPYQVTLDPEEEPQEDADEAPAEEQREEPENSSDSGQGFGNHYA